MGDSDYASLHRSRLDDCLGCWGELDVDSEFIRSLSPHPFEPKAMARIYYQLDAQQIPKYGFVPLDGTWRNLGVEVVCYLFCELGACFWLELADLQNYMDDLRSNFETVSRNGAIGLLVPMTTLNAIGQGFSLTWEADQRRKGVKVA